MTTLSAIDPHPYGAPPLTLLGVEPLRAALEYASMRFMDKGSLPQGDGHPVVIFPGLATDRRATEPLKLFCEELGYTAYDWGRGFNTGPTGDVDRWLDELADHVRELVAHHHETVSLIGWSLGGIYAREVAKKLPRRVRRVITIGTPFAGTAEQTNVAWVYRLVNGQKPPLDDALTQQLRTAPPVPTTSIYSRTDGVVAWQACLNEPGPHTENIEVEGSHCGLGWNPGVLQVVAQRLGQGLQA
jgi:pimeloyl-ACP methyl ester carboxylesterase